jgi:hypothetical protein
MSRDAKGVGDLIAIATKSIGLDKLAEKVAKTIGYDDCGCDKRREDLNKTFPLKSNKDK